MTTDTDAWERRAELVGRTFHGEFTLDEASHRLFTDAVFAGPWGGTHAHPAVLHLVAHCGKGLTLAEFFDVIGTQLDAGVTFGEGRLEYFGALSIGDTYRVVTTINDIERKVGRRKGPFNVVRCRIEVRDLTGELVGVSHESYVVPVAEVAA